jgi:acyl-CoA reductase-like NAD-dependent aldehyde dehydrogenase
MSAVVTDHAAAVAAADAAATTPMTPKERTAYLNAEHARISSELDALYSRGSKEWYAVFDAHPTIQDWRADFHHRMNASKGW